MRDIGVFELNEETDELERIGGYVREWKFPNSDEILTPEERDNPQLVVDRLNGPKLFAVPMENDTETEIGNPMARRAVDSTRE